MKAAGKLRARFPRELYPQIYIALERGWDPDMKELWEAYKPAAEEYIMDSVNDPVEAAEYIKEMEATSDPDKMWEYMEEQDNFFLNLARKFNETEEVT